MIKVEKDFDDIPASLSNNTTKEHRQRCIDQGKYVTSDRYKKDDTKEKLSSIYHGKCVYCEQDISDNNQHVEHYRPKDIYYWLAHSWDNLLFCCDRCNQFKSNNFKIDGIKAEFDPSKLDQIHSLGVSYDDLEKPLMVNPEKEDVEELLTFDDAGRISSSDDRVQYTINTCGISRDESCAKRKKITDTLRKKIMSRIAEGRRNEIPGLINDFKDEANDLTFEYLAYRRYVLKHFSKFISI